MMIQRNVLISTISIIFAFFIADDEAGVVLRNFKSRRAIMEEETLNLSLNLTNSSVYSNEAVKALSLMDTNLKNSSNKITDINDLTIGLKNISKSQTKNLKGTSKKKIPTFKAQKSVLALNKTSLRKPNNLMNSFVEYLENTDKDKNFSSENSNKISSGRSFILTKSVVEYFENRGMEDTILASRNENSNKINFRKPIILTQSVVEYLESRGKRMEDTLLVSEIDKNATHIWISGYKTNESAPFRLISSINENIINNEIGENSSLATSVHLEKNKEMSEVFPAHQELVNHTLKKSELVAKKHWQQVDMKNSDIVKEISNINVSGLHGEIISEITTHENNDIQIPEESESTELENFVSVNHLKVPELKIPSNVFISGAAPTEDRSNFTVNTESFKMSLENEEIINFKQKETIDNESSIDPILNQTEKDIEPQEFSDIVKQTAKDIEEILPASNKTMTVEDIEEFVVNLTDTVQSMDDEDIIHLDPEDEHISQSIQNENTSEKETSVTGLNDTQKENELNLESIVSSGLDFITNSDVAKNAAMAMEIFNLSDSSLTDHVIEDSNMHSFIDIMMPSTLLNEIEDRESIVPKEIINSSLKLTEVEQKTLNSTFNASIVKDGVIILENVLHSNAQPNTTSVSIERICPTPGLCMLWFMGRDTCSDHSQCLGEKMCCRVRCSKNCIDVFS